MATTTISYIRDGRAVRLLQTKTKTGIPCCVQCNRPIPREYRERRERVGRVPWFCTDACCITFANDVAGEAWVKP